MAKAKKLPSGKWRALVYDYTDSNGKRKYQSFTAETKKEAEFLAADYSLNKKTRQSTSDLTLYEAYTRYIESKSNVLSPSTIRGYVGCQNRDFPTLMNRKIKTITQEDIQIAINEECLNHSPKTIRNKHGLLYSVLSVYHPNLKINTTLPQKQKIQSFIPTTSEVKSLLEATQGTEMHKAILLAAIGTCRRSEVCAVLKSDITDNGVYINKAIVKNKDGNWVTKHTTKTEAGTRFVPLPKNVIDELLKCTYEKVVNLVPQSITSCFPKLCLNTLGKKYKFHELRHYSASVMHTLGIPDKYIMERGGWESKEVLDKVYTHTMSDEEKKYNDIIFKYFESIS